MYYNSGVELGLGLGIGDGDGGWGRGLGTAIGGLGLVFQGGVISSKKYQFERLAVSDRSKSQPRSAVSGNKYLVLAVNG